MPTIIKSTSDAAQLGDLSSYSVSTAAIPVDSNDTSGSVPTFSTTLADGVDADYHIGEQLTLANQAIGSYDGEIIGVSYAANSGRETLSATTFFDRFNTDQRIYPIDAYTAPSVLGPIAALDYWTQVCGVFYDDVPGDVLFYQSHAGHMFGYSKDATLPIVSSSYVNANSEQPVFPYSNGRTVFTFGKYATVQVNLPAKQRTAILLPTPAEEQVAVFSSGVTNLGSGRQSNIVWNLVDSKGQAFAVKAVIDNSAGISFYVSDPSIAVGPDGTQFSLLGSVPQAINGTYRFHLGVAAETGSAFVHTTFSWSVVSASNVLVGSDSLTRTLMFTGSMSLVNVIFTSANQGSGSAMTHFGDYISIMPSVPTKLPALRKNMVPGRIPIELFPGFSGNVWEHMKQYCSIFQLDVACVDGSLTIGPRQTAVTSVFALSESSTQINKRDKARFVEVVNQNSVSTKQNGYTIPAVMWAADSVYQVAVGETQTFKVQTDNSILTVLQPTAVTGINPYPYKTGGGQYVVTGSDGYIVSPQFWRDQGGSITAATTDVEGEIEVTIKGPDYDSPRAPYRISEGDAGRPALYISGYGYLNTPETLRIGTGNSSAAKEVGATLSSPFITNTRLAYDAAVKAARTFSAPDITTAFTETLDYDAVSDMGKSPSGALVRRGGNIMRVTDATVTPSKVSGNMTQHNTIKLVKKSFGTGTKIKDAKAYYAGKTIRQTNVKPLKQVQ